MSKQLYVPPSAKRNSVHPVHIDSTCGSKCSGASILVLSQCDGKIYALVGREAFSKARNTYSDFGGKRNKRESCEEAAAREFMEESCNTFCLYKGEPNTRRTIAHNLQKKMYLDRFDFYMKFGCHKTPCYYTTFVCLIPWDPYIPAKFLTERRNMMNVKSRNSLCRLEMNKLMWVSLPVLINSVVHSKVSTWPKPKIPCRTFFIIRLREMFHILNNRVASSWYSKEYYYNCEKSTKINTYTPPLTMSVTGSSNPSAAAAASSSVPFGNLDATNKMKITMSDDAPDYMIGDEVFATLYNTSQHPHVCLDVVPGVLDISTVDTSREQVGMLNDTGPAIRIHGYSTVHKTASVTKCINRSRGRGMYQAQDIPVQQYIVIREDIYKDSKRNVEDDQQLARNIIHFRQFVVQLDKMKIKSRAISTGDEPVKKPQMVEILKDGDIDPQTEEDITRMLEAQKNNQYTESSKQFGQNFTAIAVTTSPCFDMFKVDDSEILDHPDCTLTRDDFDNAIVISLTSPWPTEEKCDQYRANKANKHFKYARVFTVPLYKWIVLSAVFDTRTKASIRKIERSQLQHEFAVGRRSTEEKYDTQEHEYAKRARFKELQLKQLERYRQTLSAEEQEIVLGVVEEEGNAVEEETPKDNAVEEEGNAVEE